MCVGGGGRGKDTLLSQLDIYIKGYIHKKIAFPLTKECLFFVYDLHKQEHFGYDICDIGCG